MWASSLLRPEPAAGGHIITIDVLPEARKAGVGSQLLHAAEERLRAAGCHLWFWRPPWTTGRHWPSTKRHEYNVIARSRAYYSDGVDACVLKKDLLSRHSQLSCPMSPGRMKIAIQGEAGSFSHEAARRMVPGCEIVPCARSVEVFDRVRTGPVAAAVIPIENSLAGSVTEHFDLLLARKVFIERELRLRIVHNLIALPGVKRGDLRRAYSHPVALEQCRDFFTRNPKIQPTPFYDTAGSVKHVIESGLRDAAGIAGAQAAKAYNGHILAAGIEDDKRNFTRFFLIRKNPAGSARREQDFDCLQRQERCGRAVQGTGGVRAARHQLDQDRVASPPRPALGVRVLRRLSSRR